MNILVCLKQVPETNEVKIDENKGTLIREGIDAKTNVYDLHALELAVNLKGRYGGEVTVLSMGPPQAATMIKEAYSLGADRGVLLSDRRFAGADTLATAYTLAQAIKQLPTPDLILTGMQTSDGDTAQVGPAIAALLDIPHVSYVLAVEGLAHEPAALIVKADMQEAALTLQVRMPCLLTCTKDVSFPRLPSYKLLQATAQKPVEIWTYDDIKPEGEPGVFGLDGSPTRVEKIFPPTFNIKREMWEGTADQLAERLRDRLKELRIV